MSTGLLCGEMSIELNSLRHLNSIQFLQISILPPSCFREDKSQIKMWYEILPSFGIIAGAICASGIGLKIVDWIECEGKVCCFELPKSQYILDFYSKNHTCVGPAQSVVPCWLTSVIIIV